ncbi:MAG: cytochrome c, partial [Beijerinckiaceae bacterium]|nr:cytochrome c [Beijerinckiaceae bacterium]
THAHEGAKGVVKERMDMMLDIAKQLKYIARTIRGEQKFDAQSIANAATGIAGHGNRFSKLFPKGSNGHPSEATDNVWKQWSKFVDQSNGMSKAASALANKVGYAAKSADILPEFRQLAATCGACHKSFRVKK